MTKEEIIQACWNAGKVVAPPLVAFIASKIFWPMWKKRKERLKQEADRKQNQTRMIEKIYYQLHPNGGGSLADSVNAMNNQISELRTDVTGIKKRIGKMAAKQEIMQSMQNIPVCITDEQGNWDNFSPALIALLGIKEDYFRDRGWLAFVSKTRDGKDVATVYFRAVEDKRGFDEFVEFKLNTGEVVKTHMLALPMFDQYSKTKEYLGLYIEIKEVEEKQLAA